MIGTKKHLVGKSIILVIIISFFLKNCKENENQDLSSLLNLKNYTLNKVKVNDSIIKIVGKNKDYKLNGLYNSKSNEKIGWWKIEDLNDDNIYDIEYVSPKYPKENQIKIYKKEILQKELSMYYEYSMIKDKFILKIYYPKSSEKIDKVSFQYITGDTIKKMRINQGNVECKFENDCYQCQIPISDNENAISGIAGIFTYKKNKKEITLGNTNIYITTKK